MFPMASDDPLGSPPRAHQGLRSRSTHDPPNPFRLLTAAPTSSEASRPPQAGLSCHDRPHKATPQTALGGACSRLCNTAGQGRSGALARPGRGSARAPQLSRRAWAPEGGLQRPARNTHAKHRRRARRAACSGGRQPHSVILVGTAILPPPAPLLLFRKRFAAGKPHWGPLREASAAIFDAGTAPSPKERRKPSRAVIG